MNLAAFHNDTTIRQFYVERVLAHQLANEIIQGTSWKTDAAGAVGCTLQNNQHSQYEDELGIPRQLAYLEDRIFEGLPKVEAKAFPFTFLTSIPVGADLSLVLARLMLWLLSDPESGVLRFAGRHGQAITAVASLYQRILSGEAISKQEWPPLINAAAARGKAALEAATAFTKENAFAVAASASAASHAYDAAVVAAAAGYTSYGSDDVDPEVISAITATVAAFGYGDIAAVAADYGDATAFMVAYGDDLAAYAGLVVDRSAAACDPSERNGVARKALYRTMRDKLLALLREAPAAGNQ